MGTKQQTDAATIAALRMEIDRLRKQCKTLQAENERLQQALVGSITG